MHMSRGIILVSLLLLGSLIFSQLPAPRHDIEVLRDLVYAEVSSETLRLDLYRPLGATEPTPIILAIHGGSWVAGTRDEVRPFAEALAAQGYAVASIGYRNAPRSLYPAQIEDARSAACWLAEHAAEYRFNMHRFHILGVSAGGQMAAMLGVQPADGVPRPASVVLFFAPTDFTAPVPSLKAKIAVRVYLGADREEKPDLYKQASPITYISADDPPFLLLHGTKDPLVPPTQSTRFEAACRAKGVPVSYHPLQGMGHQMPDPSTPLGKEALAEVLAFLALPVAK